MSFLLRTIYKLKLQTQWICLHWSLPKSPIQKINHKWVLCPVNLRSSRWLIYWIWVKLLLADCQCHVMICCNMLIISSRKLCFAFVEILNTICSLSPYCLIPGGTLIHISHDPHCVDTYNGPLLTQVQHTKHSATHTYWPGLTYFASDAKSAPMWSYKGGLSHLMSYQSATWC